MDIVRELRRSLFIALALAVITFPVMVIRVNTTTDTVEWQWGRLIVVGLGGFVVSFAWNLLLSRQQGHPRRARDEEGTLLDRLLGRVGLTRDTFRKPKVLLPISAVVVALAIVFPFITSLYQTNIMISALIYVILALGLNIVIGLGGMLHLGYAAFYAVGAYTYAILNRYFGVGFWVALPLGAGMSALFGVLLAIPVLRLRGDYLAIVTLGFGEIIRLVLNNWDTYTLGAAGMKGIARPNLFGFALNMHGAIILTYFIVVALVIITVLIVNRMENSRIGRQWVAMGEDDVAARAMGVDTNRAKLRAFAIGAIWAGIAGVVFAAKTTFINPAGFRVWESVLVLCMVVLGGMGSIPGVIVGALILVLLPEYLRVFSDYRLLIFGAILVVMMVFRPGGMIPKRRKLYRLKPEQLAGEGAAGPESGDSQ